MTKDIEKQEAVPDTICVILDDYHPVWNVGIVAAALGGTLLYRFAYPAQWLQVCGTIMFGLALVLFCVVTTLSALKLFYYKTWRPLDDPFVSCFWGPYSVAFSTLLNMCHYLFEDKPHLAIWALWWVNVTLALFSGWFILFRIFYRAKLCGSDIHGMLILSVLPLTVVASTGALIVPSLPSQNLKLITMIVSFLLFSNGVLSGFCIVVVLYWRYLTAGVPETPFVFTLFAPAGLFGHASWGLLLQGTNVKAFLAEFHPETAYIGDMTHFASLPCSLFFLGFGVWFIFLVSAGCVVRDRVPLGRAWFNMTFPLGALSLPFHEIYTMFGLQAFGVVSAMLAILCIMVVFVSLTSAIIKDFPYKKLRALCTK